MATYKEIKGTQIEVLASDPSNPIEGQVWFNSTSNVLKGRILNPAGSWTTANSINTARGGLAGAGTTTAAIVLGGEVPPYNAQTETWNGTNWTEVNDLNVARSIMGAVGTTTAALGFGGIVDPSPQPTVNISLTELWNGTNWTEVADLNTARYGMIGSGGKPTAMVTAGEDNGPPTAAAKEFVNG